MDLTVIYEKKSYLQSKNEIVKKEISAKKNICNPVSFSCHEENGKWGIWLDINDYHILIHPIDLFNSIFADYWLFRSYTVIDGGVVGRNRIIIDIVRETYMYTWTLMDESSGLLRRCYYIQDAYISAIKRLCVDFYHKMQDNVNIAYDSIDLNIDKMKLLSQQISVSSIFPSFIVKRTQDIIIEDLIFKFLGDERYVIGFKGRYYETFLSHWDNDLDEIRHQFESIYYGKNSTLELSFDGSELTLKLKRVEILNEVNEGEKGVGYQYKEYMLLEIISNDFADMPTLRGYCDVKTSIRTLYEGFLNMAIDSGEFNDYYKGKLDVYNRFKSPLIEACLSDSSDCKGIMMRQVIVENVFIMNPLCIMFLMDMDGEEYSFEELKELCGKSLLVDGIEDWYDEANYLFSQLGEGLPLHEDWTDHHYRGLDIAGQLRKVLPEKYDLWYKSFFEDDEKIPELTLIV